MPTSKSTLVGKNPADGIVCKQNNLDGFVVMLKMANSVIDRQYRPSRVFGVDFSGAIDAGTKIWVASGTIVSNILKVEDCLQAKDLPDSSAERDKCLCSLRDFISKQKESAFGLDFPFGLPKEVIKVSNNWEEFVLSFSDCYADPEQFRRACRMVACGSEPKRATDEEAETPWCAYNLRLYKQTYYGIRYVLSPLVQEQLVCVLPMQTISPHIPWLFEICPASTLKKKLGITLSYKGGTKEKDKEKYSVRECILRQMEKEKTGNLVIPDSNLRLRILSDRHGDALDSVIAAFATFRALSNPAWFFAPRTSDYAREGYVYV